MNSKLKMILIIYLAEVEGIACFTDPRVAMFQIHTRYKARTIRPNSNQKYTFVASMQLENTSPQIFFVKIANLKLVDSDVFSFLPILLGQNSLKIGRNNQVFGCLEQKILIKCKCEYSSKTNLFEATNSFLQCYLLYIKIVRNTQLNLHAREGCSNLG